jgi:hypothetical protein
MRDEDRGDLWSGVVTNRAWPRGLFDAAAVTARGAVIIGLAVVAAPLVGRAQPYQVLQFSFSQRIGVDVGTEVGPKSVTVADVNKDGIPDVIAIDQEDDAVWVLLGHGDGTFEIPEDPDDLIVTPNAIAVADIASPEGPPDGNPDLIATAMDGDVAEILLGDGTGSFSDDGQDLTDIIEDSEDTIGVVVGNFDTDPATDVALLDLSDEDVSRMLFLCNTSGNLIPCSTFEVDTKGTGPVDVGIGDLDSDGNFDVVALNQASATFSPMYGDGEGGFTTDPRTFPAQADLSSGNNTPDSLALGPLTIDGTDGVVVANAETFSDISTLAAVPQGRDRFVRNGETGPFSSFVAVALGDIDGDTYLDAGLSYVSPSGETTLGPAFLIGDGSGGFVDSLASVRFVGGSQPGPGLALVLADLDDNLLADIVQVSAAGDHITVALNTSDKVPPTVTSTVTPTITETRPPTSTRTPTATFTGVANVTATGTQTATPTSTPVLIIEDDGCAIANPASRGGATELMGGLAGLLLSALRRRFGRVASE